MKQGLTTYAPEGGKLQESLDLLAQIDLFDGAPPGLVGAGAIRITPALRRLVDAGVVSVAMEDGKVKVRTTHDGRGFLSGIRSLRGRI